jgi:hypothetical protein
MGQQIAEVGNVSISDGEYWALSIITRVSVIY